jgi:sporulation protein YlmC with PRC-barrel domain
MNEIPINAKVECADGSCGHSTDLIVNPVQKKITHFVVSDKTLPDFSDRLVPVEEVTETSSSLIRLRCTRAELAQMQPFTTTHFVQHDIPSYIDAPMEADGMVVWGAPWVTYDPEYVPVPEHHIPAGEQSVHRGMAVHAGEHKVGQVDELVVDPSGEKITHLMMRTGHLWGKKDVAIPVSAIESVSEDAVWLNIDKEAIGALPSVPVKRHSD